MAKTQPYLSFRVGQQWYGLPVEAVTEVLHLIALAEVPTEEPYLLGLMTLREAVMPVVDLRRQFGFAEAPYALTTPILAVRAPRGAIGLVADEVDTVERVAEEQLVAYHGPAIARVSGVARASGRLLLLLDLAQLDTDAQPPSEPDCQEPGSTPG